MERKINLIEVNEMEKKTSSGTAGTNIAAPKKGLTLWAFFAMTASMVMTVYEYPSFASSGMHLVFFLLIGGIFWFLPVALCAAEMATVKGWQSGGLYTWVANTLGQRWGFAAIFYQWFQITVGFITMIYFIVGALSYALNWQALNDNVWIKLCATLIIFWLITFSQFFGIKNTARIAKIGFFVGVLGMGIVLFVLAIIYVIAGGPIQVKMSGVSSWIPDFSNLSTLVIFVSFILAYAGVESSASHANEMKNPGRDYPLAMFMLVICAIVLDTLGGFTVAMTTPTKILGLNTGVIQAFQHIVKYFGGAEWIVRIFAVILCLGVIAEIAAWVVGPSAALKTAAENGLLPKKLAEVNKHNVPVPLTIVQGVIVTIWAFVLTLGGGGNANLSFFVAMALTVCIYLVGYALLFLGYIVLVHKHPDYPRAFHIPGGKGFKTVVAVVGLIISVFAFFISFVPPSNIASGKSGAYLTMLIVCWAIMTVIPFIIYSAYSKKNYQKVQAARKAQLAESDSHSSSEAIKSTVAVSKQDTTPVKKDLSDSNTINAVKDDKDQS